MPSDRSSQPRDHQTITLFVAIAVGVVALVALAIIDPSNDVDGTEVSFGIVPPQPTEEADAQPVRMAHAPVASIAAKRLAPAATAERKEAEAWSADDSLQGARPDASH